MPEDVKHSVRRSGKASVLICLHHDAHNAASSSIVARSLVCSTRSGWLAFNSFACHRVSASYRASNLLRTPNGEPTLGVVRIGKWLELGSREPRTVLTAMSRGEESSL